MHSEVVHQERKARSYRARAKRIRAWIAATGAPNRDPSSRPRRISDRPRSSEGNENLAYLLDRDVRAIGPERAAAPPAPNIRLLISPSGSYRYVGLENGRPVSALQIMSHDGGVRGVIENVYTTPFARRRGWAARLLEVARRRFREVKHSDDLSPAGEAWKGSVRDPESARRRRALSLHEDASRANRRLSAERYRYLDKPQPPTKNLARWHARVATLAREASDLWAVTADAYEEAGDVDMGELTRLKSHALNVLAIDYTAGIARDARRPRRDPNDEEEAESWPLDEVQKQNLQRHIAAAENAEVDADLEEDYGNLRESRARSREAAAHYYAAADVAAVPTVHNRADLRRLDQRIELLEHAWRSFRRGRAFHGAELVRRLIESLQALQARRVREIGD